MVKSEAEVLDCPVWLMLINVVALEMLKAKLPHSLGLCCQLTESLTNPPSPTYSRTTKRVAAFLPQ